MLPKVNSSSLANNSTAMPTSAVIQIQFNKPINPLTVTTSTFQVYPSNTFIPVVGAISVSSDGLSATLSPVTPLDPSTNYVVSASTGVTDLEG